MAIAASSRRPYLLVFRDASARANRAVSPQQMADLLCGWLEWHDRLDAQGIVRFRSSVDAKSRSVSEEGGALACCSRFEQGDPIVGYLLIDAANIEEATEVARSCPGLGYGFVVEIYRSHGCPLSAGASSSED